MISNTLEMKRLLLQGKSRKLWSVSKTLKEIFEIKLNKIKLRKNKQIVPCGSQIVDHLLGISDLVSNEGVIKIHLQKSSDTRVHYIHSYQFRAHNEHTTIRSFKKK